VIEIALALSSLGAVLLAVVLTAFAIGVWRVVYEVGLLVAAHLANLGKVTVGQLDPDRSVVEKVWFAILLIAAVAALLAGESLRCFTPERWAVKAGLFLLLACAAGLAEYIRYMVKWRGVLFAAWDLLAWIGAGLAIFALIALLASLAKGCYDAIRPDPGDAHSRNHAAVRAKPCEYRDAFESILAGIHDVFISRAVQVGDFSPLVSTDYVRQKIRDGYLRDSTVTATALLRST